ncbi:MAG: MarR family transcriptional regulator [Chthonomonadetes bacterium]|nr:MarR family transcriptional regulator [Chthonomonadetes bacterium]
MKTMEPDYEYAVRVSNLFAQILTKSLSERLVAELTHEEITLPQLQAMRYIWLHRNATVGEVAEGLDISYPSATNMLNRLVRKGLVSRHGNPADRRFVEVQITEKGERITRQVEEERVARLKQVLDEMSPEDRQALIDGLRAFIVTAVEKDNRMIEEICLRCGVQANGNCPITELYPTIACR